MIDDSFAYELKQWRADAGYTQAEAAVFLDVSIRTYQEWEQGRQAPDQKGPIRKAIELSKRARKETHHG